MSDPEAVTPRVGLVLGAGGVVGQAYEAGVLTALSHDLGWDPRDAEIIVGSSAGSVTGALLRLGVSAHDLSAWAIEAPLSGESRDVHAALDGDREFPSLSWEDLLRSWRPPSAALVVRAARRPWRFRASVAAMTLLPTGRVGIEDRCAPFDALSDGQWPDGLLVCTVRRSDGQRVVFGRRPMGVDRGRAATADVLLRRAAHRRLDRELRGLQDRGTAVVRFEPSTSVLHAMGLNLMATDRAARVVQEAFFDAGRLAATAENATLLAMLGTRVRVS